MYHRQITQLIAEALEDTPVIVLNGARQTGKSTLCQQLLDNNIFTGQLITFDDPTVLAAAQTDPLGFVNDRGDHLILDEVQRVPELFLSIKKTVDQDRPDRRFILTGSVDVMMLPTIADSLAGRLEIHNLWPLSQGEIMNQPATFLEKLTAQENEFTPSRSSWQEVLQAISIGGYPEVIQRKADRRTRWFASYMLSVLQKDIRELANIEGLTQLPNILQLVATRVGSTINLSDIARLSGVKNTTLQRYMALLEHVFLLIKIPAWTPNSEGRFVKSPKLYLNDSGLLGYLRGEDAESLLENRTTAGAFLENFVVMEIIKQLSWSDQTLTPYHFSLHQGAEVDLVLENRKGHLFGIEIKSAATLRESDFKGLKYLAALAPDKFQKGIILYRGEQTLRFGDRLYAVPVSNLWHE